MQVITRKEAVQQGLSRYYTGEPCKYGHIAERNRSNGGCLICLNEKQKKRWRETYIPKPKKHSKLRALNDSAIKAGQKTFRAPFRCSKGHEPIRITAKIIGNCKCLACYEEDLAKKREVRKRKAVEKIKQIEKIYKRETVTRKEAKRLGEKTYFTGKPCKYGHVAENYVHCGGCVECRENYYQENKASFYYRAKIRKSTVKMATPLWACYESIQTKYKERETMSKVTGLVHHVDHIIPLQGENVCGLHVASNLRVILARDNLAKSNKH